MKTTNHDEERDKPIPPPTDAQLIKGWVAEADSYYKAGADHNDYYGGRAHGHAEARRELAELLEANRKARQEYVKATGDRLVRAATDAGKAVADFMNKLHAKAEERAGQDRK